MKLTRSIASFTALMTVSLGVVALTASAVEARPNTKDFTCTGVRDYIEQKGTVVMNTKNSNVYRKFYAPHYQCPFSNVHTRYDAPTKTGMCTLFICREPRRPFFERHN